MQRFHCPLLALDDTHTHQPLQGDYPRSSGDISTCPQGTEPVQVAHKSDIDHRSVNYLFMHFGLAIAKVLKGTWDNFLQPNIFSSGPYRIIEEKNSC